MKKSEWEEFENFDAELENLKKAIMDEFGWIGKIIWWILEVLARITSLSLSDIFWRIYFMISTPEILLFLLWAVLFFTGWNFDLHWVTFIGGALFGFQFFAFLARFIPAEEEDGNDNG